ncbi:MAG TPA: extracellular solute-binding protein [Polyangiales bacterium]|nr:extracellular solute-binding protein [Polyangiales bacterium]
MSTLRVQSWLGGWGSALRDAICEPFERETGVRVEQVPHVGLKLPAALLHALEDGSQPPVDVVWSNAVPALRAEEVGQCVPLELDARNLRARAFAGREAFARGVVHPYVVYYVLVYREAAFEQGAPSSWEALLDPRHRGKVAVYPGGNGLYPIAQIMGGGDLTAYPHELEPCWRFMQKLAPQIGELEYSIGMEERLRSGALDLCFRALTNALAFRAAGLRVSWCIPREGTTDTLDAFWIPRGTPNTALAQRFIAFAMRPGTQSHFCKALGAMPVHRAAQIPELLQSCAALPAHADDQQGILSVSELLKAEHEAKLEHQFNEVMRRHKTLQT